MSGTSIIAQIFIPLSILVCCGNKDTFMHWSKVAERNLGIVVAGQIKLMKHDMTVK